MGRLVLLSALASAVSLPVAAQSVISAHSGVVHFIEGSVSIDGQPIEQKPGRFQEVKEGSELRTDAGRAEVLLTPGAFLRVGPNSAIRMICNRLSDTRIEFLKGSAVLESTDASSATPVTISLKGCQVRFLKQGRYRIDSEPAEVKAYEGEAEVVREGTPATVRAGYALALTPGAVARKTGDPSGDSLDNWDQSRTDAIAASNAQAAQTDDFSGAVDTYPDAADPTVQSFWVSLVGPLNGYPQLAGSMPFSFATYGLWGYSPWIPLGIYARPELRFAYFSPNSSTRRFPLAGINRSPSPLSYRYYSPTGRVGGVGYHPSVHVATPVHAGHR